MPHSGALGLGIVLAGAVLAKCDRQFPCIQDPRRHFRFRSSLSVQDVKEILQSGSSLDMTRIQGIDRFHAWIRQHPALGRCF